MDQQNNGLHLSMNSESDLKQGRSVPVLASLSTLAEGAPPPSSLSSSKCQGMSE